MNKPQVMVMSPIWPAALKVLAARFDLLRADEAADRDAFLKATGKDCRAVILNGHGSLGPDQLRHLPKLELVSCSHGGF